MAVAYLTAGDALDDVRRLGDGANQQAPGDAHNAMAETVDPPEIPDVDNRVPEVTEEMLTREPRQHIVLFSAFVTSELESSSSESRWLGIS